MPGLDPGIHVLLGLFRGEDVDGRDKPGHDGETTRRRPLDASSHVTSDETSIRYDGWRIVVVCFLLATFGWGLGFYGQSVYVAELHRLHGWPASLISSGTTFFYLFGAVLVAFVSEAIRAFGPRNCLIAGIVAMAVAAVVIGQVDASPGSFMLANAVLAFGWAGTSLGIITNTLGLWFDKKRGMAISLALNGASFGGIVGVPLLVAAIGAFRILRRDDRGRDRDGRADGPGDPDLRRPAAACIERSAAGGRPMRRRRRRSARRRCATSPSSRYRSRSRWCCSRRSASSST